MCAPVCKFGLQSNGVSGYLPFTLGEESLWNGSGPFRDACKMQYVRSNFRWNTPKLALLYGEDLEENLSWVHGISKVDGGCWSWFLQVPSHLGLGWEVGEKWYLSALLFLETSPKDPCSLLHDLGLVNKSPSHISQVFFKLVLLCCISVIKT